MDRAARDLVVVALVSLAGLCLAWRFEADFFAMIFAAASVIAGLEAARRLL
jgi:hypothetical protein